VSNRKATFLATSAAFVVILIVITVILNLLIGALPSSMARIDLTENKEYTLSDATKRILSRLKDIVSITYYVSKKVPTGFETVRRDTVDFLKELQLAAPPGKIRLRVVDPEEEAKRIAAQREEAKKRKKEAAEAAGKKYEEEETPEFDPLTGGFRKRKRSEYEKVLDEFMQRGIRRMQAQEIRGSEVKFGTFYSAIELSYLGKRSEVIPDHRSLENLEYEMASRILKLTIPEEERPVVAFFDGQPKKNPPPQPNQPFPPPQNQQDEYQILKDQVLRQLFKVEETKITKDDPIPEKTRTLIVAQPKDLNDRQVYEINKFVSSGGNAIFLVSRYNVDDRFFRVTPVSTGLEKLFGAWGLRLDARPLNSLQCGVILTQRPARTPLGRIIIQQAESVPSHVLAMATELKRDSALVRGISNLVFPWAVALRIDPPDVLGKKNLEAEILVKSPLSKSWFGDPSATTVMALWANGPDLRRGDLESFTDWAEPQPLVVQLRGKFPFIYEGKDVPQWPKEESEEKEGEKKKEAEKTEEEKPQKAKLEQPKEAVVLVIGSGEFCKDKYIRYHRQMYLGNYIFMRNVVEALSLSDDLIQIRAKQSPLRPIDPKIKPETKTILKWLNVAGVPLLVGLAGLLYAFFRRQVSAAYERQVAMRQGPGGTPKAGSGQ